MKVLVQRKLTFEYFAGGTAWSVDAHAALDFEKAGRAAEFCRDLEDVRIILKSRQHFTEMRFRRPSDRLLTTPCISAEYVMRANQLQL